MTQNVPATRARPRLKLLVASGVAAILLYTSFVALLAVFQRRLIYVPDTAEPAMPAAAAALVRAVDVRTSDGLTLAAWFTPPAGPAEPVVLYLHGNGGNRGGGIGTLLALRRLGWGAMMLDYRGYGGNPGAPSETGLIEDARAAYAGLRASGIAAHRILLWGQSLGSGVATRLAGEVEIGALLLESPYTSIAAIAKGRYPYAPVDLLLRDRFDQIGRIGAVRAPVLVMAGALDDIVPPWMGRAVFDAAPEPKRYWLAPRAGHNDLGAAGAIDAAASFVHQYWQPSP